MMEQNGTNDKPVGVGKILGKLRENRHSIFIQRLPLDTKQKFIKLAEDDFCGDYGMALKWLIDDIISQDTREIISIINSHEERLNVLEPNKTKEVKTETSSRKMLDGRTVG